MRAAAADRDGGFGAQQLELRIDHFDAPGAQGIEIGFAVQNDALSDAKSSVQIRAVKKFAVQHAGGVAHQKVINGAAPAGEACDAGIGDDSLKCVDGARHDFCDRSEMDAVFVTKREISEQIAHGVDAARGQGRGALRSHALQVFDFGGICEGHRLCIYIIVVAGSK